MDEKRQSTDANTELIQMLELSDKNFKATIIKVLQKVSRKTKKTKLLLYVILL